MSSQGFVTVFTIVNEDERNSRQEKERPLGNTGACDHDLAAIADRAFHFTFFDDVHSKILFTGSDYESGNNRVSLYSTSGRSSFGSWSTLLSRAFGSARVLRNEIDPEI